MSGALHRFSVICCLGANGLILYRVDGWFVQSRRWAGIGVNLHYIPVYRQPYYRELGFGQGYCPNAEAYYAEAISIPMFPALTDDEQQEVIAAVTKVVTS